VLIYSGVVCPRWIFIYIPCFIQCGVLEKYGAADEQTDGHLATTLQSRIETGVSLHMSEVLCVTQNEWIFASSAESEHEFNATVGCFQCFDLHWSQITAFPSRTPRGLFSKSL